MQRKHINENYLYAYRWNINNTKFNLKFSKTILYYKDQNTYI